MTSYRGLTWDHPRGRDALEAAARRGAADSDSWLDITWDTQALTGFETRSLHDVVDDYDLIVLDHPHLGEALRTDSLLPLDSVFSAAELDTWSDATVGNSFDAYRLDGHPWALPIDAATQVAAARIGQVDDFPQTWSEVDALASRRSVALSISGPHAIVTFASVCVALGEEPAGGDYFISTETGSEVFELLTGIAARAVDGVDGLDPIQLLERMSEVGDLHYIPLVFGYVTFAGHEVRFGDAPSAVVGGRRGSTLGGAGLALSRNCKVDDGLAAYARWLMSPAAQGGFIPQHSGQPSARSAWIDAGLNAATDNFYSATLATIDDAWVRPRYAGYVAFQTEASDVVRAVLGGALSAPAGVESLNRLHHMHVVSAREGARS